MTGVQTCALPFCAAEATAIETFAGGGAGEDLPTLAVGAEGMRIGAVLTEIGFTASNGEAKRKIAEGAVKLDGETVTQPHDKIGVIFQEPRLLPWLSVADNVGFGIAHRPKDEREKRVARALERVGLSDKANVWPRELSGGQAQRVAIARALVPRPEVLLLDEPFSALDTFTRSDLQDHLLALWADSRPTLIHVTHDVDEAIALGDRVLVMRPRPGQVADEIRIDLPRPRDRQSAAFDFAKIGRAHV